MRAANLRNYDLQHCQCGAAAKTSAPIRLDIFREHDVTFRCSSVALLVGAMVVTTTARAHDELKVFASRSTLPASGGKSTIFLSEGHALPVDELLAAESIVRYDLFSPGGTKSELQISGISIQANVVQFKERGVHSVVAARRPSVWTWVIDEKGERKFMRRSKLDYREKKIETSTRYSEFAKTLVVVGEPDESPLKPVGPESKSSQWTARPGGKRIRTSDSRCFKTASPFR